MKYGPFSLSDEVLFRPPYSLTTWAECVELWNDLLDYEAERETWLHQAVMCSIRQDENIGFVKAFFEDHLDALVARLVLTRTLIERAFEQAVRIELGWEPGMVLEIRVEDGRGGPEEDRLAQIDRGGLPRRNKPGTTFRIGTSLVERFGDLWLSCPSSFVFLELSVAEARALTTRRDVRALKPSEAPQTWMPAELGAAEVLRKLSNAHNPNGFFNDRRSVLFNFWEQSLRLQSDSPENHPREHDIVRVAPKGKPAFHVPAARYEASEGYLSCYHTRNVAGVSDQTSLISLESIRVKLSELSVVVPATRFLPPGEHVSVLALYALAVRENLRLASPRRK